MLYVLIFAYIIICRFFFCKFFALIFFFPFQTSDCALDLPQQHFGNIAGGCAEQGDGGDRIEVVKVGEVLGSQIQRSIVAATGEKHIRDGIFKCLAKLHLHIEIVQFL